MFSSTQVVQQRRSQDPPARDPANNVFALGTSNSASRTNEERKQAIQATAMTLQARLAQEKKKLEG